ncbi:MAG: response regulator [Bacteroidota bacterium]
MKKVIIIDDEEDIVDLLTYHLDKNNFSVLAISEPKTALRLVGSERPDFVIVNYLPQFGDKVHLCKNISQQIDPNITSIICLDSGSSSHELHTYADMCLNFPLDPKVLIKKLNFLSQQKANTTPG